MYLYWLVFAPLLILIKMLLEAMKKTVGMKLYLGNQQSYLERSLVLRQAGIVGMPITSCGKSIRRSRTVRCTVTE
jgi:hypothetical protein